MPSVLQSRGSNLTFQPEIELPYFANTRRVLFSEGVGAAMVSSLRIATFPVELTEALEFAQRLGGTSLTQSPELAKTARLRMSLTTEGEERFELTFKTSRDPENKHKRGELHIPIDSATFHMLMQYELGRLVEERIPIPGFIGGEPVTAELDLIVGAGPGIDYESLLRQEKFSPPEFCTVELETPDEEVFLTLLQGDHSFGFLQESLPLTRGMGAPKGAKVIRELLSTRRLACEGLTPKQLRTLLDSLSLVEPRGRDNGEFNTALLERFALHPA